MVLLSFVLTWTPMINASDFAGIQVDVGTVATALITIALSIVGVFYIINVMNR